MKQAATAETVSASAATAATNIELQKISKQLAIRSFMIKNVADGLEQQQKSLEATNNANSKNMARIQKSTNAAIRKAQITFNKFKESTASAIAQCAPAKSLPLEPPAPHSIEGQASSVCGAQYAALVSAAPEMPPPLPPPLLPPTDFSRAHGAPETASASGALKLPATAPMQLESPAPPSIEGQPPQKIAVGSLVQVATEHATALAYHGAWGTVTSMLPDGMLLIGDQTVNGRVRTVHISWCCLLREPPPTPPRPWKKNTAWLKKSQKDTIKDVWLPVALDVKPVATGTQLAESEVAAGSCEILWRLCVEGAVVVPPCLTSMVARHIIHNWAADDRHNEGHELVCQLNEYAARAQLLVLPFQSETHWTLLVLEREQQLPSPSKQDLPKTDEIAEDAKQYGCEKCRGTDQNGAGCLDCNEVKTIAHWTRITNEDRGLNPKKELQPIELPQPWVAIRYYDTLQHPSQECAALAISILDALQPVGVRHHLSPERLAQERHNSRRQEGVSCGFWVLHYIEEELRRFRGEGVFSFHPNLENRCMLLNGFVEKVR